MVCHGWSGRRAAQVLGHLPGLDGLDAHPLERLGELHHLRRLVHAPASLQPRVHAKIEAIGLVEVGLPCWCWR